ncbi:MAG: hypothetical protein GX279_06455 [Clostridiaceae bacterium]|nr:hypothetical protein [Clostridiaceae bacterium]
MRKLIKSIIILSVFDAAATIAGIEFNYISEGNPVVASFVIQDPFVVCTFVCVIVVALILLVYRFGKKIRWIKYSLYLILAVKAVVVCLHVTMIALAVGKGLI